MQKEEFLVHSVFLSIQGEGPYIGIPAVFIRLAGCNLQCEFCDTAFDATRPPVTLQELMQAVADTEKECLPTLAVITGGEPMMQAIAPLVAALKARGQQVQIETNGSFHDAEVTDLKPTIVCSPKGDKVALSPDHVTAWKYLVSATDQFRDGIPVQYYRVPILREALIYLQPMDHVDAVMNQYSLNTTLKMCLNYGYNLSPQLHKLLELE